MKQQRSHKIKIFSCLDMNYITLIVVSKISYSMAALTILFSRLFLLN